LPAVTVIIPARDEAHVIGHLVADLAAQDHRAVDGKPRFDLVIVDDHSTDGTGEAARRAVERHAIGDVTRIVRRDGPETHGDGKGTALAAVAPESCQGDVIVVFDADARIGTDFLRSLASHFARGITAMTASRRMVAAGDSAFVQQLTIAQDDEQVADGELQAGRWALGGCSEFRGSGMALSRDLLVGLGGWPRGALADDLELSAHVAARTGLGVAWAPDVVVWEEPVRSVRALWRQRARWAEGSVRRYVELTPGLLQSPTLPVPAKVDFAMYGMQTVMPMVLAGLFLGSVEARRGHLLMLLAAMYAGSSFLLGMDSLGGEETSRGRRPPTQERWKRSGRLIVFGCHWLAVVPYGWLRVVFGPADCRFDRTRHWGMPAGWRPPSAST